MRYFSVLLGILSFFRFQRIKSGQPFWGCPQKDVLFSSLDKWEVVNYSLPQRNVPFPTTSEAQEFFRMYHSYSEITNPSDCMRWCRYRLGLLQKDVAAMVGMEEWLYQDLESSAFHRSFTPELADKLAALYGISVEDILDDYTLFLHRGGGAFLRRYREAKGWSRQQLADHAKVSRTSIRCWESGQKTISQKCFCHLVENLGSDFPSMLRM